MSASPPAAGRRGGTLAQIVPLAVTVVIFVVIFARIPFAKFTDAIARADLLPFLGLMASFSVAFFLVDTFVLTKMLNWFHGPIAYRELLPVRATTYLVSIVNTQLAQGALGLYVHRRFLTPLGQIFGTVGVLILLEVTQLVLFATAGMLAFPSVVPLGLLWSPIGVAVAWIVLLLIAHGKLGGAKIRDHVLFQTLRRARATQLATVLALKASVFVLSLFVHSVALGLFGIHIPLLRLLAFLPIVFMTAALPVTVAHLGTSQAAWIYFFSDYAAEADLLAYSLASHLTFMLANGSLGLLFLPKAYADLFVHRRQDDIAKRAETTPAA
jgi:hypothetical protein